MSGVHLLSFAILLANHFIPRKHFIPCKSGTVISLFLSGYRGAFLETIGPQYGYFIELPNWNVLRNYMYIGPSSTSICAYQSVRDMMIQSTEKLHI